MLLTCVGAGGQDIAKDAVFSEKEAFLMLPPTAISQGETVKLSWSDSGRYLLVLRRDEGITPALLKTFFTQAQPVPPAPAFSVGLWDARNSKFTEMWRQSSENGIVDFAWFAGTQSALIWLFSPRTQTLSLQRLDAQAGTMRPITEGFLAEAPPVVSLLRPVAAIHGMKVTEGRRGYEATLQFVDASGALSKALSRKGGEGAMWTSTGLYAYHGRLPQETKWTGIDPATMSEEELDLVPKPEFKPPAQNPVELASASQAISARDTSARLSPIWLRSIVRSKKQFALVCADAQAVELAPDLESIAYVSQGVTMVRPIVRVPRAMVEAAMEAAEKARLISNSKQVALAFLMYSMDHNDTLPGGADALSLIEPYLKNAGISDGFVYTFAGGDLTKVDRPAETILGYIQGPGGRAVAYVDGHVRWIKDP